MIKPDWFLKERYKFIMRNIRYVIPVLFHTVFSEDASNATVEAHRDKRVCGAISVNHTRERSVTIATEFGIIEQSVQIAASFKWFYAGK